MPNRLLTGRLIPDPWGRILWTVCRPLYHYIDGILFKRMLVALWDSMTEEQKERTRSAMRAMANAGISMGELQQGLERLQKSYLPAN